MASGTKLGTMYWETAIDNAGLNKGLDQSQQQVEGFGQKASGAFGALTVAAGNLLASGIEKLASGIMNIGVNAVSATAQMQAMQVGMEGLLAREMARGEEATRSYQVTSSLNAKEQQEVTDLTLKLDQMNAKLQEKKQHLWEIKNRWTDEGLAAQTAAADIAVYENNIGKTVAQLEALRAKQGAVNTVTEKYWINTTTIADAMPMAQERAKALMDELARISIVSPYQVDAVQQTFKLAMAFGYTADEATKYTSALLNVAAGTGASNEMLQRMAYNFAQVRMQGKVTAVDIRQLAMAGFDLNGVLRSVGEQFGVNIRNHEDFNAAIANGSITWAQFTDGFAKYADEQFGGASERMSRTLIGLQSTFHDLFMLTLPTIVGPALESVTGLLSDFLTSLLKIRESGVLDKMGESLRVIAERGVNSIRGLAALPGVIKGLLDWDGRNMQEKLEILSVLPEKLKAIALAGADLITAFRDGGVAGVLGGLFDMAQHWWDASGETWLTNAINAALEWIWKIPGKISDAIGTITDTAKNILVTVWEALYKWWETGGEAWLVTTATTVWGYVAKLPGKIYDLWISTATDIASWLAFIWNRLASWWENGGETWASETAGKILDYIGKIPVKLSELLIGAGMNVGEWLVTIWDKLNVWWDTGGEQWATDTAEKINSALSSLQATLTGVTAPAWASQSVLWLEDVWMGIAGWWDGHAGQLTDSASLGIANWFTGDLIPALRNKDKSTWADGLGEALSDAWYGIGDWLDQNSKQIAYSLGDIIGSMVAKSIELMAEFISIPLLLVGAIYNAVVGNENSEAWDKLYNIGFWIISGIYEGFRRTIEGSDFLQGIWDGINQILQGIADALGIGGETDENGVPVANSTRGFGQSMIAGLLKSLWEGNPKVSEWRDRLVSEALQSATIWVEALVQSGRDTITGLLKGMNEYKGKVIRWIQGLVGDLIQAVKDMFDMHSPSLVMAQLGEYIILGLIEGMEGIAPEAVATMSDAMTKILGAVSSAVQGLTALANMGDVGGATGNLARAVKQIKELLPILVDLAEFYKGTTTIATAQEFTKPLAEILSGLKTVVEAAAAIANIDVTEDRLRRVNGVIASLMEVIKTVISGVTGMASGISKDDLVQAMMVAEAVAPVLQAFKLAVDVAEGLLSVSTAQIGPRVDALALVIGSLIKKVTWLANSVTPEILSSSAEAAGKITQALAPWRVMIDTFEAFSNMVVRHNIGEKAVALTTVIERLIRKVTWLSNLIGDATLTNSARVAADIVKALAPWKVMIDTVAALAESVIASGIGEKATALTTVVERLILKITWLANLIGDTALANSARVAKMIVDALAPWQVMIDTVTAIANMQGFDEIGPNAQLLSEGVEASILALSRIANGISEETLLKAAEVGRLLSDVLSPWEDAIKLSDEMRAWRIMPDLVERFTRFARQWVQIVENLATAVAALDVDGLALVAAFGDALGALVAGLSDALTLALAMPAEWTDPPSWDAFTAWVQDAFLTFYNWIVGWGGGGSEDPPMPTFDDGVLDMVGRFGEALGALMGGLKAALDLALALPAEWTEPPSWDTFVTWVQEAFLTFYNWIIGWGTGGSEDPPMPTFDDGVIDMVGVFGNALSALMGGLKAALDLALALPAEWTEPASWADFATWVQDAFLLFAQWVSDNFPTPEDPEAPDQFGAIIGFGNALGALMSGLSSALTVALALPAEWEVPDSWVPFRDWVTAVFGQFMLWVDTYFPTPEDPEAPDQFGAIIGFGNALGALMGGLSSALDLALALPTTWTAPSQEMWDAFFGWVTDVFDAFVTYVEENYPVDPESAAVFAPVQAFGEAMGAVFDGLTSALDLFVDLANWAGPSSTFNTRLQTFLEAVSSAITYISTYVAANINPDDLPALADFGTALSTLVGGLSDALDLFAALADTDPAVYTESTLFEDRVGNLLLSISGTLSAFSEYILSPEGSTAWEADVQSFYDAVETVFGTLSSALAFFADLETTGLPPTPEIQAFVTAITDLFSTVATQLGSLTSPNGAMTLAIAAVEGVISGFPAVMDGYQDGWWDSMGDLAGQLPAALAASVGTTTTPNTLRWGIDQLQHEIVSFSGWWIPNVAVPAWLTAGTALAQALVDGLLSLAGPDGAVYNAGYALAQSGLDGFNAGAGLAGAMANAMPDGMMGHGFTMDTTHTWELNISGIGSPTGLDLSTAAVDQITSMLRDKILRGG